jgi:hypothetical protein
MHGNRAATLTDSESIRSTGLAGPLRGWQEALLVVLGYSAFTVVLLWPLASHAGSAARFDNADTRLLIWNVAWVAHALVVDPVHVFDANIFFPHSGTLAYSESNLGAGLLAMPVYWSTGSAVAAYNFAVLASFVLSAAAMYYLVRYLTRDRRAAAVAGICFAFCPYVFSHLPHVHLLMTAGLPLGLLAFHRAADRPTPGRGLVLGLAVAAETVFCGYYGVFVGLSVGLAALIEAAVRRRWIDVRYWTTMALAGATAVALVVPLFLPFMHLARSGGFARRSDADARLFSATLRTYFASPAVAHAWMLSIIQRWNEVLFPGFVATAFGIAGAWTGWKTPALRATTAVYVGLAVAAFWASFGPAAGFYGLLAATVPAFTLMRAPSRFGLVVTFGLCVLAGMAIARLLVSLDRASRRRGLAAWAAAALSLTAAAELHTHLTFSERPPIDPVYTILASLPRGGLLEVPVYSQAAAEERTWYMLNSTVHWMPLVNAYSSYTPRDFIADLAVLGGFPSAESIDRLEQEGVRYAVVHLDAVSDDVRGDLIARLDAFRPRLRQLYGSDRTRLYEIVGAAD